MTKFDTLSLEDKADVLKDVERMCSRNKDAAELIKKGLRLGVHCAACLHSQNNCACTPRE